MYGWIWRHLPGPTALKTLQALILLAVAVVLLFAVVFPWAERSLPFLDVTVESSPVAAAAYAMSSAR